MTNKHQQNRMSLKIPSQKLLTMIPQPIVWAFLGVSLLGFLDATYLTIKYYQDVAPTCSLIKGCEEVTTSRYATIEGIPVALLGAIYYLSIFLLTVAYLDTKRERIFNFAARSTSIGFLASLWFVYLQLFVIKAICIYCMVSAATSTVLFGLGIFATKIFLNDER
jgi:uncharacterized membrane protein